MLKRLSIGALIFTVVTIIFCLAFSASAEGQHGPDTRPTTTIPPTTPGPDSVQQPGASPVVYCEFDSKGECQKVFHAFSTDKLHLTVDAPSYGGYWVVFVKGGTQSGNDVISATQISDWTWVAR
jgi:hypothetical protein